jgi:hypothetical protein
VLGIVANVNFELCAVCNCWWQQSSLLHQKNKEDGGYKVHRTNRRVTRCWGQATGLVPARGKAAVSNGIDRKGDRIDIVTGTITREIHQHDAHVV